MKNIVNERIKSLFHIRKDSPTRNQTVLIERSSTSNIGKADIQNLLQRRKTLLQRTVYLHKKDALLREIDRLLTFTSRHNYGRCTTCNEQIPWTTLLINPLEKHCATHRTPAEHQVFVEDTRIGARAMASPHYPLKQRCNAIGWGGMGEVYHEAFTTLSPDEMVKEAVQASAIQSSLLPEHGLRLGKWETSYAYLPARTVSGDYCDLISDTCNVQLFFCFGDGMGKGIVGCIISSLLHSLIRTIVAFRREETLSTMVERANRLLCEEFCRLEFGCFATVIMGCATDDGVLEVVNAGHPPAFLVRSSGATPLEATGPPLGLFYTSTYGSVRVPLTHGQAILMYTDGITEAQDHSGLEYGRERLARVIEQHGVLSAEELVGACVRDVKTFTADCPLNDDRTILVVRRA